MTGKSHIYDICQR